MSCFLAVPAEAKSVEKDTYRVCKSDIFIEYDQLNCKKIVTKVKDDGSFTAIDLGEWLEEQDIYDISVIEDDENIGYKKRFIKEIQKKRHQMNFMIQKRLLILISRDWCMRRCHPRFAF